jgi:DNA-binding Lrp family transcriptional regulator
MNIPQLDATGRRVLQVIRDRGVVTGRELAAEAGLTPEVLLPIVQKLISSDLVSASGNIYDTNQVGDAYFNIRPSNLPLAEFVLRSSA